MEKQITENIMMEKFSFLVETAQKYIQENANFLLLLPENKKYKSCFDLISNEYKPCYKIEDFKSEDWKLKLLQRFCVEMQNYQAMPRAINYMSFGSRMENEIFKIAKSCMENKDFNSNTFYNKCKELVRFEEKKRDKNGHVYNYAWQKYAVSMASVIKYLTFLQKEDFYYYLKIMNNDNETKKQRKILKNMTKIRYFGNALAYDLFKEIGCINLIKPDVHIEEISKEILGLNKKNLVETFIQLCKIYKSKVQNDEYTPYYIDKILWLCCTGKFYEHSIIITKMTRKNFLKYLEDNRTNSLAGLT